MKYTGLGFAGLAVPGLASSCSNELITGPVSKTFSTIYEKVCNTLFIDTHEHLFNESTRVEAGEMVGYKEFEWTYKANDWSYLFSHYFCNDLRTAGMDEASWTRFFKRSDTGIMEKWDLLEPFWPFLKYTGYGLNVRISLKEVYGIDDLNKETVGLLQQKYKDLIRPGFYQKIIREVAGIESCQVNTWPLFLESEIPDLLYSDLSVGSLIEEIDDSFGEQAGISVTELEDWHGVIDYFFDLYGKKAIAVKVATAYSRNIDFVRTDADLVKEYFRQKRAGKVLEPKHEKMLQDHLFWYCADRATEMGLPVKLHTGYYAGNNYLKPDRISLNPDAIAGLCSESPETKFVVFHIGYPNYEEMLAVAKNFTNAYMDMCWSWIVNPIAAKDFLKKFIMTVPLNKITTFGGDYMPVELIPGHARIARI
ncbi:MAG: amidohydrolase family protein, partial [Anaerolineales bacterium]|nr:amidohydrolase family protein [Anaerolineales bacterium]